MVAEKETEKQNIRQTAEKEIQHLNDDLEKAKQQIQSVNQEKVKRAHVVFQKDIYFYSLTICNILSCILKIVSLISFLNQVKSDALLRKEMEQLKEEKDNEIRNITAKYETTVTKLKAKLSDGSLQIQTLRAEKVNAYLCNI